MLLNVGQPEVVAAGRLRAVDVAGTKVNVATARGRLWSKEHFMKLSTVAFVLAGALALAAMGASPLAVNDTQRAPMFATNRPVVVASVAAVLSTSAWVVAAVERLVTATHRHEGRRHPVRPAPQHRHRSDSAIQVSVDDVYDRIRRALRERAFS
jgi:hypothetical protein